VRLVGKYSTNYPFLRAVVSNRSPLSLLCLLLPCGVRTYVSRSSCSHTVRAPTHSKMCSQPPESQCPPSRRIQSRHSKMCAEAVPDPWLEPWEGSGFHRSRSGSGEVQARLPDKVGSMETTILLAPWSVICCSSLAKDGFCSLLYTISCIIRQLKNVVGWFIVREKYYSDWKKQKSTNYKPDEQGHREYSALTYYLCPAIDETMVCVPVKVFYD
jgi:hypothetical protein